MTEVRQFGRDSIQVMRRLRTMLENLIETLPEGRAPVLRRASPETRGRCWGVCPDCFREALVRGGVAVGTSHVNGIVM